MWTRGGVYIWEGFRVIMYLLIKSIRIAKFTIKFTYCATSSNSY
jgi:hypothetical protein